MVVAVMQLILASLKLCLSFPILAPRLPTALHRPLIPPEIRALVLCVPDL